LFRYIIRYDAIFSVHPKFIQSTSRMKCLTQVLREEMESKLLVKPNPSKKGLLYGASY